MTTYTSTEKSELKESFKEASSEYLERIENLGKAQTPIDRFNSLTDEQQDGLEYIRIKAMWDYERKNPNASAQELLTAGTKEIEDLLSLNDPQALDRAVSENLTFAASVDEKYEKLNTGDRIDDLADKMFEKFKNDPALSEDDHEILEAFCRYKALNYTEMEDHVQINKITEEKKDEFVRANILNIMKNRTH